MEDLFIEGTESIPTVSFKTNGEIRFEGRALPENAFKLFEPMIDWAKNAQVKELEIEFNLDYFNTSVSKYLFDLFREFENNNNIESLKLKWMYEDGDDEMLESGELFKEMLTRFDFTFHKYAEIFNR
jgi:hypothetical protein